MNAGQYDEDCGNNILLRLPGAKEPEAYFSTGNPDAPGSEDVPGQVKHSRQEERPMPKMKRDQNAINMH